MKKSFVIIIATLIVFTGVTWFLYVFISKKIVISKAKMFYQQGEPKKAYETYEKALKKSPENPEIYVSLGKTAEAMGNYADCIKYYEKAYQIAPDNIENLENLYWSYMLTGRLDDALAMCEKRVALAPERKSIYYSYMAEIYLTKALFADKDALQKAEEYIKMGDSSPETLYIRGKIHFLKGRNPDAIKDFEAVLSSKKLPPDDEIDIHLTLHRAYLKICEIEKAKESLHKIIELSMNWQDAEHWRLIPYPEFALLILNFHFGEKVDQEKLNKFSQRYDDLMKRGINDEWNGKEVNKIISRAIELDRIRNEDIKYVNEAIKLWERAHKIIKRYFVEESKELEYPNCFVGMMVIRSTFLSVFNACLGDLYRDIGKKREAKKYYVEGLKIDPDDCIIKKRMESL